MANIILFEKIIFQHLRFLRLEIYKREKIMDFFRNSKLSKLIIVITLFSVLSASNAYAFSNWVSNAITGGITTYSGGAGNFHSQGEDIYSLGYTRVRFGTTPGNISLFTIAPPTISMGCSGIDAMWGGFQMIVANLKKILESILAMAGPFAFDVALGILCKQCEAIMNQLEAIANKLNGINFNSCRTVQAAANVAVGALNGITQVNQVSGALNDYESGLTGMLKNVSGSIGSFVTNINNFVNCNASELNSSTPGKIAGWGNSCGSITADKKFIFGSYLRNIAEHGHLGLIGGTQPGSGGNNEILGVIRGSLIGDIVGYLPSSSTGGGNNKPTLKYNPPVSNEQLAAMQTSGMSCGSETTNTDINNPLTIFINGGQLADETVDWTAADTTTPVALNTLIKETNTPFVGAAPIIESYLYGMEEQEFGTTGGDVPSSVCSGDGSSQPVLSADSQTMTALTENSPIPVVELVKMAYVNDEPSLIQNASDLIATSIIQRWLNGLIFGLNLDSSARVNLNSKTKLKVLMINIMKSKLKSVGTELQALRKNYLTKLDDEIKTLNKLNEAWVQGLTSSGAIGSYNFSQAN